MLYFYSLLIICVLNTYSTLSCMQSPCSSMSFSSPVEIEKFVVAHADNILFQACLNSISNPVQSLIAHNHLMTHARRCIMNQHFSLAWFSPLPEGSFKMALRIMYCHENSKCLDDVDAQSLIDKLNVAQNIEASYVNLEGCCDQIENFEGLLEFIIPLLEPLIKRHVCILRLSKNQLSTIPANIACLTQLQSLDLHTNKLSSLPDNMTQLQKLTFVNLSHNNFILKPKCLAHVPKVFLDDKNRLIKKKACPKSPHLPQRAQTRKKT